jgi:hypothetical protein
VSDEALRWHYRQAILRCLRAAAEPTDLEDDYDPDYDCLTQIRNGPHAELRMEMELAARLGPVEDWPSHGEQVVL